MFRLNRPFTTFTPKQDIKWPTKHILQDINKIKLHSVWILNKTINVTTPLQVTGSYINDICYNHFTVLIGKLHFISGFVWYRPLTRYARLRVAHAPGMRGTFSRPPRVSDPDGHHGTCVTHVPWCMPRSLTSGFLWSRWWGKRSRRFWRMLNPQFCVFAQRPMASVS